MTQERQRKQTNIRLNPQLWRLVRIAAATDGTTMQAWLERAIEEALKQKARPL